MCVACAWRVRFQIWGVDRVCGVHVQNLDKAGVEALVKSLNAMDVAGCEVVVAPVSMHLDKVAVPTRQEQLMMSKRVPLSTAAEACVVEQSRQGWCR